MSIRSTGRLRLLLGLLLGAGPLAAQAPVNPDISVVGSFLGTLSDRPGEPDRGRPRLAFEELELAVDGPLNPWASGSVKVSFSDEGADVEEAYATLTRGLPWRLQLKAGRYLVGLGRLNSQHPHQWLWIDRPLMAAGLFGDEGLKEAGLQLSTLQPLGPGALTASIDLLDGGALIDPDGPYAPETHDLGWCGRLAYFQELGRGLHLDLGLSALRERIDPVVLSDAAAAALPDFSPDRRFATVGAVDGKLKWKRSEYSTVSLVGEWLLQTRTLQDLELDLALEAVASDRTVTSQGGFVAAEVRFLKRFDAGAFIDGSQAIDLDGVSASGVGAYGAFSLAEETLRFGLAARRDSGTGVDPWWSGRLQVLFSMGPHKPHQF